MHRVCQLLLLACLTVSPAQLARAQNTQNRFWPELDTYLKLDQRTRLSLYVREMTGGNAYNSIMINPNLDIYVRPIRKRLHTGDIAKNNYLSFRIGYRHYYNLDRPDENRALLDMTPRTLLPGLLLLSDRNRGELRWIGGQFSWRYRNRLILERDFRAGRVSFTPFAWGEVYFDSRYDAWVNNSYSVGVELPLGRFMEARTYFRRNNQSRASRPHVNVFGLTWSLYF